MADDDKEQRTEEATSKRLREAREKGQFATSKEISSVVGMAGSLLIFHFYGTTMFMRLMNYTSYSFAQFAHIEITIQVINSIFHQALREIFFILSPLMVIMLLLGVLSNVAQSGGFIFSTEKLKPKFSKLDPIKGFGRLFSLQSLAELVKSILKISLVGYIAYSTIKGEFFLGIPLLTYKTVGQMLLYIGGIAGKIFFRVIVMMIFLAVIDYGFQRYEHNKSLRMTKQSVKQEQKEVEGDPQIKARIRAVQRDISKRRMMKAVPEADVIITNPQHLAIAVKYDRFSMSAPKVVAKGAGHIAKRIREIAGENEVPLVENKPVAQILYKTVKIGEEVPEQFYKAVAEILAYVFKLKGMKGVV